MRKTQVLMILIGFIIIFPFILGAGQRFYLSQYEEECMQQSKRVFKLVNVTLYDVCIDREDCDYIMCPCFEYGNLTGMQFRGQPTHCIKYRLVRKVA